MTCIRKPFLFSILSTHKFSLTFSGRKFMCLLLFLFTLFQESKASIKLLYSNYLAAPVVTGTISDYNGFNVSCPSSSDGSIDLDINGGILPYSFIWSNGETTEDISLLPAGPYTVTVTDGNGDTATETFTLTEPSPIQSVGSIIQNVTCFGLSNGGVNKTFAGGVISYTFLWSDGSTNEDLDNVLAGTYDVTVTDLNGCTAFFDNHLIIQPDSIQFQPSVFIAACDQSVGAIDLTTIGGTQPFTFLWSGGETSEDISNLAGGTYTVTATDGNVCTAIDSFVVGGTSNPVILTDSINTAFCDGGSSGAIYISTSGAAIANYSWSDSEITEDITNLIAGTYTVTVTDVNSCSASGSFIVPGTTNPVITIDSVQNVLCNNGSTGAVFISVSGSSSNTFTWSGGAVSEDLINVIAGIYTVTVTDLNGCTDIDSSLIIEPTQLTVSLNNSTNVSCFGGANGAININPAGGTINYSYEWSNSATSQNLSAIQAGTYTVTVTDANFCSVTDSYSITEPGVLSVSLTGSTNVSCFNGSNGAININPAGGTINYSYQWSNSATSQNLSALQAGIYTVTVTDANLCSVTDSYSITEPGVLSVSLTGSTNVSCFNGSNGAININPAGGTINYSYQWSNGATTQNISSLQARTYTVTVTDANLCSVTDSYSITEPSALTVSLAGSTNVSCSGGGNGSININVTGGTIGYTYAWSNGATSQNLSALQAGTYTVTVTDANFCSATDAYTITGPNSFSVALSNSSNISCFGGTNGSIDITPSGGTAGYTYSWSNGSTSQDLAGLSFGTYTVTVTDANLCTINGTYSLTQPTALSISLINSSNVSCFGGANGAINITPNGGSSGYTYNWSNGSNSQDLTGIGLGTYTLTVTDVNSCSVTGVYSITQPTVLSINLVNSNNVSCFGGSNGSINITPNGGTTGYSYAWSNGASSQDLTGINFGTYTITVTDANSCTATNAYSLTQPSAVSISLVSSTNVSCFNGANGAINITPNGGTTGYTYNWSNGITTQDLNGLTAGTYTVTVSDLNSCTASNSYVISQPTILTIALTSSSSVSCFGGSNGLINITPAGGVGSYLYNWSNGATSQDLNNVPAGVYTLTITDANSCTKNSSFTVIQPTALAIGLVNQSDVTCFGGSDGELKINATGGAGSYSYNWSNGAITQNITSIIAGNYTVTVTDQNTCSKSNGYSIIQPPNIQVNITTQNAGCGLLNGSASINCSGGTGGFSFLWNTGATSQTITSLAPNTYTVTATDQNGCSRISNVSILQVAGPDLVIDSIRDVTCFGLNNGAIYTTATGGTGPLIYLWNNLAITDDLVNVGAGTYTLVVTDLLLCSDTIIATINEPAQLAANLTSTASACGQNNGSVSSSVTGGTGPFTYAWSNSQTTANITNLAPGTYTVTVTDFNLCTTTSSRTVGTLNAPSLVVDSVKNVKCFGQANGAIYTTTTGGNGPLTYVWSPGGSPLQDLTGIAVGNYTLIVTDSVNCKDTVTASITQPVVLGVTLSNTASACGQNNGSVSSSVTGGTGPFTYAWSNSQTTANITNLAPGTYTVTVTDFNLCTTTSSRTVGTLNAPSLVVDSVKNVKCFGQANGAIYTTTTGGNGPLTYVWSPGGSPLQDLTGIAIGNYTLIVTDSVNCKDTVTASITQPAVLTVTLTPAASACGQNNGSVSSSVTGGTGAGTYTYLWSNSQSTSSISNLAPATYTVTVTDDNLCTKSASSVVGNITGGPILAVDSIRNVKCFGQATGGAFINSTGTATPFSFLWSNGALTEDIQNVLSGSYTITVTDTNNCSNSISVTITQPLTAINATISSTSATCGNLNGTASTVASGGTPGYTYLWNNSQTTPTISNLAGGNYTVTVKDANLCSIIKNVTVNSTPTISVVLDSTKNVKCFNASDGAIYTTVMGGSGTITYQWSPIQPGATDDLINIGPGGYTLIVSDTNSCRDTVSAIITQPGQLVVNVTTISERCGTNNGSATAIVSGGTPLFSYVWNTSAITSSITNLTQSTYTVTVTDANLCNATASGIVDSLGTPSITLDSIKNVTCNGFANGSIYISASGGNGTLSYAWSAGSIVSQDLLNVASGNYTVTVSDTNSCSVTQTFTVSQPLALSTVMSFTSSTCGSNNGTASVDVTGGNPPYSYSWNNGPPQDSISNLAAGNYIVTVTDSTGCTKIDSVLVGQDGAPSITIDSVVQVKCNNGSDGAIYTSTIGGTPLFTYTWSSPVTNTSENNINIPPGTYTITVTDDNGCKDSAIVTLNNPQAIQTAFTNTPAKCNLNNGTASVNASGGSGVYSYQWNTSATDTLSSVSGLNNGTYTVTVTDNNGCSIIDSVVVSRIATTNAVVDSIHNVSCHGLSDGDIFITPSGGDGSYTYQWDFGGITTQDLIDVSSGTYAVVVSDGSSCTFTLSNIPVTQNPQLGAVTSSSTTGCGSSTGTATATGTGGTGPGTYSYEWTPGNIHQQTITGLAAGTYTVTVTDGNSCTYSTTANVVTSSGPALTIDSIRMVNCFGDSTGAVFISTGGGTSPYIYAWSNGKTSEDLINVGAGTYTLTVTDDNQCVAVISATVTENPLVVPNFSTVPASCGLANGIAVANPSGGTGGYTYIWTGFPGNTTNVLTGSANTYPIRITDNVGCFIDTSVTISNPNSPVVTLDSIVNLNCVGGTNGAVYVTVSGGTLPYTSYSWQGTSPLQITEDATGLSQGTYTFIVRDGANCTTTVPYTIDTLYSRINIAFTVVDPTCGFNNGQITATVTGGNNSLYTYAWSVPGTTPVLTGLQAGSYTLTVTDGVSCTQTAIATLSNITGASVTFTDSTNVSCFGGNNGSITTSITGGTQPYTILWQDSVTTPSRSNLATGNYTITVKDANGCVTVRTIFISQPPAFTVTANVPVRNAPYNVTCNGSSDGEIDLTVSGGTPFLNTGIPTYAYQWSISGATSSSVLNIPAGSYNVTISDSLGCINTSSYLLIEPPLLYAGISNNISICGLDSTIISALAPLYGTGQWSLLSGTATIVNADSATTTVKDLGTGTSTFAWIVKDNFCSDTALTFVTVKERVFSDAGIDQNICKNTLVLSAVPPQFGTGVWNVYGSTTAIIEDTSAANSLANNLILGQNIFTWTVQNGNCTDVDTVVIELLPPEQCLIDLDMPTGFTPNGDGLNDYFVVRGLDDESNKISIFNRWGNLVYEKSNYQNDWDGKSKAKQDLPDGTYYVILNVPSRNTVLKSYIDLRR